MLFRLQFNHKCQLTVTGFSEPSDCDADDIAVWFPSWPISEPTIDLEKAKYLIATVGDRFCELVEQEKDAMSWVTPDMKIAWKRAVITTREMCDVCSTSVFNMHGSCHMCGFVACIDCYRLRQKKGVSCDDPRTYTKECGQRWQICPETRKYHEPMDMLITQIIPSHALWVLSRKVREVRDKWGISANRPCHLSNNSIAQLPALTDSSSISGKEQAFHSAGMNGDGRTRNIPVPKYTIVETTALFPDVKHSWLNNGRLLRLLEPQDSSNMKLFQQQWSRGQVSCTRFSYS